MRRLRLFLALCLLAVVFFSLLNGALAQVRPLIVDSVDTASRVTLKGNVHPLARPEFDRGAAPADLPLNRMLLVLKRSLEQDAALQKLLDDQQDKASPQYRRWLTPEQFGQQFGLSDSDLGVIITWLQGQGFRDIHPSKGRTIIEFSGTAAQVQNAFATSIRKFVVEGKSHWANATDPSIPMAFRPAVAGVLTLHDLYKRPLLHLTENQFTAKAVVGSHPQFTGSNGLHALTPADYYKIYNFNPLGAFSPSLAVVGRSNINEQDVMYFHYWMYDQASSPQIVLNGPDPGDLGGGEETEAVLDTTWAGAVAPSSWLSLVVSQSTATTDGVDLSELYIIDHNFADVMSESFGACEAEFTTTQAAGISALAQQAAAQGITYVVSSGDSGSAGCDNPNFQTTATHGLGVNMLASTPYTVAVGGTVFNENGHASSYWNSTNDPYTLESALSYIPENVWNDSCPSGKCSKPNIWAAGGGASGLFPKPSWQAGVTGIPSDNARDLPDVSLTAASHDPYLLCLRGSCIPNSQGQISFYGISGTSASAPAFAAIMSLVANDAGVRLGNPNYILYRLAAAGNLTSCNGSSTTLPASTCVFNDVTVGNNAVPGESKYGTSSATYQAQKGYDLATGLGSVNVTNLINDWSTVTFHPTSTTFSISPTSAVHGSPLSVTGTVAPSSGAGTPSGTVWVVGGAPHGNLVGDSSVDFFPLDAHGAFSGTSHLMPGGTFFISAHYAGDQTYGGSDSTPAVQVTIQSEPTTVTFSVLTKDGSGNFVPFTSGPYGTPVYYQAHVGWQSGYGTPGSYVNFWDTNGASGSGWLGENGLAQTQALTQISAGAHSITAGYYGDNSFSSSANLTPVNFTITHLATNTNLASQQTAQSLLLTATVSASGTGSPATGPVTFSSGATVLGTSYLNNGTTSNGTTQATATFDASQLTPGPYNVQASYPGDANYTASTSAVVPLNLVADFTVADRGIGSQTVTAGQTAQYINDLGVNPFFGFNSTVTASCSVDAKGTTCSVTPSSFDLSLGAGIGTVYVGTTSRVLAAAGQDGNRAAPPFLLASAVALFCSVGVGIHGRSRRALFAPALLVFALAFGLVACGGGGSNGGGGGGGGGGVNPNGTPAGTYPVTVTAVSGTTTHTMSFTMVVR